MGNGMTTFERKYKIKCVIKDIRTRPAMELGKNQFITLEAK